MPANRYADAIRAMQIQRGNALALVREAAGEAPGLVAAHQLEAWLLLCSRDVRDFEAAGWVYARFSRMAMSPRERLHSDAIAVAVDGEYAEASRMLDRIVEQDPHDYVALAVAHVFDHYLGNSEALRSRSSRALRHWSEAQPGFHAVLSLHAFALEECGDYGAAEKDARRALELEPLDVRAHHTVAHVLEMQGRAEEGVRWMGRRSALWTGAGAASTHLWWHLALYQVELGRVALALEVYDRRLQGDSLPELIDASALLWRLHLAGFDVSGRMRALAARWEPRAEDAHCAFADLHAMMAFAGAQSWTSAARLLAAQARRVALTRGSNYDMVRLAGLPACRALAAFGHGEYEQAETLLRALPPVAHRMGGSHAQRDVLQLTRAAAAARRASARWLPKAA